MPGCLICLLRIPPPAGKQVGGQLLRPAGGPNQLQHQRHHCAAAGAPAGSDASGPLLLDTHIHVLCLSGVINRASEWGPKTMLSVVQPQSDMQSKVMSTGPCPKGASCAAGRVCDRAQRQPPRGGRAARPAQPSGLQADQQQQQQQLRPATGIQAAAAAAALPSCRPRQQAASAEQRSERRLAVGTLRPTAGGQAQEGELPLCHVSCLIWPFQGVSLCYVSSNKFKAS